MITMPATTVIIPETANKGLENIIACTSEVSTIHDATLLFRGYTIEDLAAQCSFEEVIFLLWEGRLPNTAELASFRQQLGKSATLSPEILQLCEQVAHTGGHAMAKLRTVVSAFGLSDPQAENCSPESVKAKALRLTAALGPMIAAITRFEQHLPLVGAEPEQSLAWNFLKMMRAKAPTEAETHLFDTALVLHADHELNASTFTARTVASTQSDYYSAITAAIGSLKGPLHGGANEQVMLMLKDIGSWDQVDAFIADALSAKKKVMGIGHRVYKNGDPRAKILKELSLKVCKNAGLEDYHRMLVKIQEQMEAKKGLMPNVDFYSGLVYTALGLRPKDFTPIFVMSRVTGWTAQIIEQYAHNRIYRPRAFYTGPTDLKITPLAQR